jgi:large subunit ribosomal protein L24
MKKVHVKKGDQVVVIAGAARGRRGKVLSVLVKRQSVILEAADDGGKKKDGDDKAEPVDKRKMIKPTLHYLRKSQEKPQGGLLWLEGPIHLSNVMLVEKFDARAAKRGVTPAAE